MRRRGFLGRLLGLAAAPVISEALPAQVVEPIIKHPPPEITPLLFQPLRTYMTGLPATFIGYHSVSVLDGLKYLPSPIEEEEEEEDDHF